MRRKNAPREREDYFDASKNTKFISRTFRRRSRSWWIRSRRGHFFKVVRDETGVEIRVFVWWFLYIRVCILKFYATKTEEGVKRKRRERRRGGFLEKIFFRRRLAFLAAGEKIFPLFWFTTFEKKGHSSTTNASPGGTGQTFLSPL